jgi:hypothetical protein
MSEMNFYVGYQPSAPPPIRRSVRRMVAGIAVLSLLVAVALVIAQAPFADSRFEYGQYREYEGEVLEWPYPTLLTSNAPFLLVGAGKFGVTALVKGHDGERVSLRGSLIARDGQQMLEIESVPLRFIPAPARTTARSADFGPVTLTGEIVDTKCYLGVMNPGGGKVHRECATRCISGGAPPAFLVRDADGETRLLLLVGADGRQLGHEVLDFVAEPITIPGQLVRQGTSLILKAEPKDFRRE